MLRTPRGGTIRPTCRPTLEMLEGRVLPSTSVLTYHNNNMRTGADLTETSLTPANVNSSDFGKLFSLQVDGNVYAEPLVMSSVSVPGQGVHDIVFVCTENDSVYAFDANSGSLLWHDNFLNPAAGVTALPTADVSNGLIVPTEGITATPVIDPSTGTLYVEAATKVVNNSGTSYVQSLHALDVATGAEKFGGPAVIQATFPGTTQGGTAVAFLPEWELERAALLLLNGVVYTSWASQVDADQSIGWVIGYNAGTLQQTEAFCTDPNGSLGTIWGAGEGAAADSSGNIYVVTGNGPFDTTTPRADYGDSVLQLAPSGNSLAVTDFFTPANQNQLNANDEDLDTGGWMLLPADAGSAAHQDLLVTRSKLGEIYLVDVNDMTGYNPGGDQIVQEIPGADSIDDPGLEFSAPAYFNNTIYWSTVGGALTAFPINNGVIGTPVPTGPDLTVGGGPSISANGSADGIAWVLDNFGYYAKQQFAGVLYAYDADTGVELWNSNEAGTRDQMGIPIKFAVPTIANGHVYVGGLDTLTVYGLLTFSDPGFEQPSVGTGSNAYQYRPSGSAWNYVGAAGLAGNGSAFGNPNAPQGTQVAFLQGASGSISQTVTFTTGGSYVINFLAAQRPGNQQTFEVLLDGNVLAAFNNFTSTSFELLTTGSFTVASGPHEITFAGTNLDAMVNGGDNTVFIDEATINPVMPAVSGAGFAQPSLGTGSGAYQYGPTGTGWTYTTGAGVAGNGSAFGNPAAPQGTQVAFLQGTGTFSQTVTFTAAGAYTVSFLAAQRPDNEQTFQVLLDGNVIGTFNNFTSTSLTLLTTGTFSAAPGAHVLTFAGTNLNDGINDGDNTVFIDQIGIWPALPAFSDPGFEQPNQAAGSFQYNPTGVAWTYTGTTGVAANGSAFGNPAAHQGTQVAFLQGTGGISQTVIFTGGGTYAISFLAAQRHGDEQTFQVLLDGNVIGTFNNFTSTGFTRLRTGSFTVAPGEHTLAFLATNLNTSVNGGDNTVFLDQAIIDPVSPGVSDAGFEQPSIGTGSGAYQYAPTGTPWTYTGGAGVAANSSAFGNPAAPEGTQVGFLQRTGTISQTVAFTAGGSYTVSFLAAQRPGNLQTFQVLLDGNRIGTFNNFTSTSYTLLTTNSFSVTPGEHTLTFAGTNLNVNVHGGDNTVFIDEPVINPALPSLGDAGFEQASIGTGSSAYQYRPTSGTPWTYAAGAGVAGNGSAFNNPLAPQGTQVEFLQGTGSISQSVAFTVGGTYTVSFLAAQRPGNQQTFQVLMDGNAVTTFNSFVSTAYALLTTDSFAVGAGLHVVTFQGTNLNVGVNGGDNTVFIDQVAINLATPVFSDLGFEQPPLGTGSGAYQYDPSGTSWAYAGSAGVAGNGSAFGNPALAAGTQVAFLQGAGSINQTVTFTDGGTYTVSFLAAQRPSDQQTFQVLIDGNVIGTFNNFTSTAYSALITDTFTVTAGMHILTFAGTNLHANVNGGDNTIFIDQVAFN